MGQPLADRIRPAALSEVVGQKHILGRTDTKNTCKIHQIKENLSIEVI